MKVDFSDKFHNCICKHVECWRNKIQHVKPYDSICNNTCRAFEKVNPFYITTKSLKFINIKLLSTLNGFHKSWHDVHLFICINFCLIFYSFLQMTNKTTEIYICIWIKHYIYCTIKLIIVKWINFIFLVTLTLFWPKQKTQHELLLFHPLSP